MIFVRNEYNYDMNEASDASGLLCEDVSLTKQSFAEEADINFIMKRFGLTGQLPSNVAMPVHGDFTASLDFHSSMNLLVQAREGFMKLPADVRRRFGNDPGLLVDFVSKEENYEEAVKLGLVVKAPAAEAASGASTASVVTPAKP